MGDAENRIKMGVVQPKIQNNNIENNKMEVEENEKPSNEVQITNNENNLNVFKQNIPSNNKSGLIKNLISVKNGRKNDILSSNNRMDDESLDFNKKRIKK